MEKITREFCIAYIKDKCDDCPELACNGDCLSESNCFEVNKKIIADLRKLEEIEKTISEINTMKYDFGNVESNNAFCCGLYAGGFSKISSIVNSENIGE